MPWISKLINLEPWPLTPDICPADADLLDYLQDVTDKRIFHFGTGKHHSIGRLRSVRNDVLGLCASTEEIQEYFRLCQQNSYLNNTYQVLYGDIYLLNFNFLPTHFDIVTLFHLAELRSTYAIHTDLDIILEFYTRLSRGGRLIAYTGSFGYPRVEHLFEQFEWQHIADYKSLRIFTK